jgi:AcrR family transcriptional regulator
MSAKNVDSARERIRQAGIKLFSERGYHGTSVRELASHVGMEAASLYHHFPSKQDLLVHILDRTMQDLLAGLDAALATSGSHEQRLHAVVQFHVVFHVERQDEAFISHSELRSLTAPNQRRNDAARDRYESALRRFLVSGVDAGVFRIQDVPLTAIAILTLCSGVADWFASQGRLSAGEVAEAYCDMVLQWVRPTC